MMEETGTTLEPTILDKVFRMEGERAASVGERQEWLRADVEALLNAQARFIGVVPKYRALSRSLLTFGLPEFSHLHTTDNVTVGTVADTFKEALSVWEPRLHRVTVAAIPNKTESTTLRLKISAKTGQDGDPFVLDSVLRSGRANVMVGDL